MTTDRLFDPKQVVMDTVGRLDRHLQSFEMLLPGISGSLYYASQSGPLYEDIVALVSVANGETDLAAWDTTSLLILQEKIQHLTELLCVPPLGPDGYTLSEGFWKSPLGQVIRYVHLHQRGEDLIDYTTAAALLFPTEKLEQSTAVKRIARRVENGELTAYTDPRVPNPKHAQRVSRQEVLSLQETLPEQATEATTFVFTWKGQKYQTANEPKSILLPDGTLLYSSVPWQSDQPKLYETVNSFSAMPLEKQAAKLNARIARLIEAQ